MDLENYIFENKEKSIRQIAKELNISRSQVSKIFKNIGIDKDSRIKEDVGKFLLENRNLSSSKLSELTGIPKSTIRGFFNRNGIEKHNIPFNENLQDVLNTYNESSSTRVVAKKYGVTHKTILKFLNKNNIDTKIQPCLTNEDIEFIILNYNKMTSTMLADMFNVSSSLISSIWTKNNLKGKKKKYFLFDIEDYFSIIDSNQKAYFLGLIASDGCLYQSLDSNKQGIVRISLHKKDIDILNFLKAELKLSKPLNFYKNYVSLEIVSDRLFGDLTQYGLTTNKTWALTLKNIPNNFILGFLLGYFDGDGSISWSLNDMNNNKLSKCGVSLCGTESSVKILSTLLDLCNLKYTVIKDNRTHKYNGNFYSICLVNTAQKYCFLKSIYSNDIYCLMRKKEKANKFLFAVENNLSNRKENINALNEYNEICHPM